MSRKIGDTFSPIVSAIWQIIIPDLIGGKKLLSLKYSPEQNRSHSFTLCLMLSNTRMVCVEGVCPALGHPHARVLMLGPGSAAMTWRACDASCQVILTFPGLFICWKLFSGFGDAFFYPYGATNSLSVLPYLFESSLFTGFVSKFWLSYETTHVPLVLMAW